MRYIFEEYGDLILQAVGGIAVLGLLIDMISADGTLHGYIVKILESVC